MHEIIDFREWFVEHEKSWAMIEKYIRDVNGFLAYHEDITKESVLGYKEKLKKEYRAKSVNSILSSINCYLEFIGKADCRARFIKLQKRSFADKERKLTRV